MTKVKCDSLKMTDVVKDVSKIWARLFDHKAFLNGEISFMLREFEQKRNDKEVDNLFRTIEDITDIKDTEIDRFKQTEDHVKKLNENLEKALDICSKLSDLEDIYKQDTTLEDSRMKRKLIWDNFMDGITSKYSEINSNFEAKEEELIKFYEEIEKKLLI
ncbi:biogenesis of lysosome-related organelles complex 1 subunit 5-like isoform X3 [Diorhabda carinulata]|uniref:biogenesis of lysosome-related organelles complex 1 subunit 5-like isoform X3 n=1 Tax=Diorhabda carinulata TaxID=1163345 RepID=UPI0025A15D17|nr:biogenesis of lysosome-related organelles complex 1 subunit 5-like isoform X3 [Diorhabda carinulata]